MTKYLICGSRKKQEFYKYVVFKELTKQLSKSDMIIEGCCKGSADEFAESFADNYFIAIEHFPSTSGNYLKRNIEMVDKCDKVIAFWDGYSYGTAHIIATAILKDKPVRIVRI